jgi:hypothetical protein
MKNTIKSLIVLSMFVFGIGYLYAWTGPTAPAPDENVSAPINVGVSEQIKEGNLILGEDLLGGNGLAKLQVAGDTLLKGKLTLIDGTEGDGKVLTSDANGVTSWKEPVAPSNNVGNSPAAIVNFDGKNCVIGAESCPIRSSRNISKVVKTAVGSYTVYFTAPMNGIDFVASGMTRFTDSPTRTAIIEMDHGVLAKEYIKIRVLGIDSGLALRDSDQVHLIVYDISPMYTSYNVCIDGTTKCVNTTSLDVVINHKNSSGYWTDSFVNQVALGDRSKGKLVVGDNNIALKAGINYWNVWGDNGDADPGTCTQGVRDEIIFANGEKITTDDWTNVVPGYLTGFLTKNNIKYVWNRSSGWSDCAAVNGGRILKVTGVE